MLIFRSLIASNWYYIVFFFFYLKKDRVLLVYFSNANKNLNYWFFPAPISPNSQQHLSGEQLHSHISCAHRHRQQLHDQHGQPQCGAPLPRPGTAAPAQDWPHWPHWPHSGHTQTATCAHSQPTCQGKKRFSFVYKWFITSSNGDLSQHRKQLS